MKQIELSQGKIAIVDDEDFERLSQYKYHASKDHDKDVFYANRTTSRKLGPQTTVPMTHDILGKPAKGLIVDHINGDTLDNRKSNLQVVTYRGNMNNRIEQRKGKLVGASYMVKLEKYRSTIMVGKKQKFLGLFDTEQQAHERYLQELKALQLAA